MPPAFQSASHRCQHEQETSCKKASFCHRLQSGRVCKTKTYVSVNVFDVEVVCCCSCFCCCCFVVDVAVAAAVIIYV